jgi:hypothetical protein
VRDPLVIEEARAQLDPPGSATYEAIQLDPSYSEQESGDATTCAVNDVTYSCYVQVDRVDDGEASRISVYRVFVAENDLDGVSSPEDVGPRVPAHVLGLEGVAG